MAVIDVEALVQEISPELPCGEDLEYDTAFGELERATQGKPEQQFGDTVIPAQQPDWGEVKTKGVELFGRTKDLRVAGHLTAALLKVDGLPGLAAGLSLIRALLERYWDSVHPQLDPDDDNDPTLRVNTIASLASPEVMLRGVREAPLVSSRGFGRFSLRDVLVATGAMQVPAESDAQLPELSAIDAAFMDCDVGELEETASAVDQAMGELRAAESQLTERIGAGQSADLGELSKLLRTAQQVLSERLERRGVGQAVTAGTQEEQAGGFASEPMAGAAAPAQVPGAIRNREDVIRVLDQLCEYFQRHEPSSPVPLLLNRAKRLISKSFIDIIRDMAPDGLSQVEMFRGLDTEE